MHPGKQCSGRRSANTKIWCIKSLEVTVDGAQCFEERQVSVKTGKQEPDHKHFYTTCKYFFLKVRSKKPLEESSKVLRW